MVLVLVKCGKISNVQAAGSAIIVVLKKAVPAVRKSCDSYHEKGVPTVRKSCDSYHEKLSRLSRKVVFFGQKPMRLDEYFQTVGKVISTFTLWIWLRIVRSL